MTADGSGRSETDLVYYEIVRDVAVVAAQTHSDPLKDPETLSQREWESSRRFFRAKYGDIPTARQICTILCDSAASHFHGASSCRWSAIPPATSRRPMNSVCRNLIVLSPGIVFCGR